MEHIGGLSAKRQHERKVFLRLLRRIRIEVKLTQAQLAKALGVTQARISKYEQGERRIDVLELKTVRTRTLSVHTIQSCCSDRA